MDVLENQWGWALGLRKRPPLVANGCGHVLGACRCAHALAGPLAARALSGHDEA